MKKSFSVLLAILAAMAIFVSSVLAAPAESKSVKLVSVSYQPGGIVLIFETSGITKADLKNHTFVANSNEQNMFCNFVDDSTKVRCVVSKGLAGDGDFHGSLAGFAFSGELPEARTFTLTCPDGQELWYSVQLYYNGVLIDSWETNNPQSFVAPPGFTIVISETYCLTTSA